MKQKQLFRCPVKKSNLKDEVSFWTVQNTRSFLPEINKMLTSTKMRAFEW